MTEVVAALILGWRPLFDLPASRSQTAGTAVGVCGRQSRIGGDSNKKALVRECQEELGITLDVGDVFYQVDHVYPDITYPPDPVSRHHRPGHPETAGAQ